MATQNPEIKSPGFGEYANKLFRVLDVVFVCLLLYKCGVVDYLTNTGSDPEAEFKHALQVGHQIIGIECGNWLQTPTVHGAQSHQGTELITNGSTHHSQTVAMDLSCMNGSEWVVPKAAVLGDEAADKLGEYSRIYDIQYEFLAGSQQRVSLGETTVQVQNGAELDIPRLTFEGLASSEVVAVRQFG